MLNKEECEKALNELRMLERANNLKKWNQVAPQINCDVIEQLIEEHFEFVEHAKQLQNEVDKYKHEYYAMCDLYENPQPYKFEDLKEGIWVWDDLSKQCVCVICSGIVGKDRYLKKFEDVYKANLKIVLVKDCRATPFKENRFFPITKALEYQEKEVKDDEI